MPTVSAIITTKSRPVEVLTAIRSVLAQTYEDFELLVVVDGPEPAVEAALHEFNAGFAVPAFRVLVNPINVGLAEARNVGVRASAGRFVAFLDDDDEWLPGKLAAQMKLAETMEGDFLFIATRFTERTALSEKIWPETLPDGRVPFSEFMYVQRGMLLPTTFLVSKSLMEAVPFTAGLRHIEDIDWMLRATADPRTRVGVCEEVLAIYNSHTSAGRESANFPWYTFYVWSIPRRHLFTPLAYSCFITKAVVPRAKLAGAGWRELLHLFSAAVLLGSFNYRAVSSFVLSVFLSKELKAKGRRLISRKARESTQPVEGRYARTSSV